MLDIASWKIDALPKNAIARCRIASAVLELCRRGHNSEPADAAGIGRRRWFWMPRIRAAGVLLASARASLARPSAPFAARFDRHIFLRSDSGKAHIHDIHLDEVFVRAAAQDREPIDPLEDFQTYTLIDPNGRLVVSANEVIATDLSIGEDAYLYRDLGDGHFRDFTHLFRTRLIGINTVGSVYATAWAVSNAIDDGGAWYANASQALGCFWLWSTGESSYRFYLRDYEDQGGDQDYVAGLAAGVDYYVTAERSGGAAFAHVYSDAGRTTLLDSLVAAPDAARSYRYIFPIGSHNNGITDRRMSLAVGDLDLQEASPPSAFLPGWSAFTNCHLGARE